ncbi:toxin-antitoxin system YwqK family antitoxin [Kitasatospora sp. NPDC101183]|uniref:toxin-antitoxin system YwqK family antitoxin n=1 Tax=Kitasatospora sp. NPDC101183 TaxID=3364100 RepID=UPI0037FC39F8
MDRVPASRIVYADDGLHHLDGAPFTGVAFTERNGVLTSESTFREGLRWGPTKEWHPSGQPMVDVEFVRGELHGRAREWHLNGRPEADGEFEFGITLWSKYWDEDGVLEDDYVLTESRSEYERLLRLRAHYGASS